MSFFISDAVAAAAPASQSPGIEGMLFPLGILVFFLLFVSASPIQARQREERNDCRHD